MLNASLTTTEEITLQSLAIAIDSLAISMAKGFESIEARMATKEDIKQMAARMDGMEERMATKDDLRDLEARMASKADLLQLEDRLTLRIVALERK